jgi:hypothetical protein
MVKIIPQFYTYDIVYNLRVVNQTNGRYFSISSAPIIIWHKAQHKLTFLTFNTKALMLRTAIFLWTFCHLVFFLLTQSVKDTLLEQKITKMTSKILVLNDPNPF